jgi:NACalpha-BTF3-like transcription factor
MNSTDENSSLPVVISATEYKRLTKADQHLKLLYEWGSLTDEPTPLVIDCGHSGCSAVMVTAGHDGWPTLHKNCTEMTTCEYQAVCSTGKCQDTYYCNHHAETDLLDEAEHQKTGETLKICFECKTYRHQVAELEKLTSFKKKDIHLVMEQARCSKKMAVEVLLKNQGDIVMAIMEIQSQ